MSSGYVECIIPKPLHTLPGSGAPLPEGIKSFKRHCTVKLEPFTRRFEAKRYYKDLDTAIVAAMTFQETVNHLILDCEGCLNNKRRKEWLAEIQLTPGTTISASIDKIKQAACSGRIQSVEESIQKAVLEVTQSACDGTNDGTNAMQEGISFNASSNTFTVIVSTENKSKIAKEFKTMKAPCELS